MKLHMTAPPLKAARKRDGYTVFLSDGTTCTTKELAERVGKSWAAIRQAAERIDNWTDPAILERCRRPKKRERGKAKRKALTNRAAVEIAASRIGW